MILTLFGYIPPARFDSIPWTAARIQQSATETGSYTLVEEIELSPADTDPANPLARSFTTELAAANDWYRIVWVDGDGNTSNPTEPVQLIVPGVSYGTTTELASALNIRNPTPDQQTALERVLLVASGEVNNEVGDETLSGWQLALATEVALERAAEHWSQLKSPFGFVSAGLSADTPFVAARDSWERHAVKLTPLKMVWGIA